MAKINLDKYYTPADLAEYCVKKTKEVIGEENITEWLEPSAGAGVFLPYLDNNYLAFDIEPEADNIERKNYLELDLSYFKGRCVIGNPPYGRALNLAKQFYKKAIKQGDSISFILPISQLKNNYELFDFDLIYSENLGKRMYSGRKVHCVLNIYKRGVNGLNKKPKYNFKDVEIRDYRRDRISSHSRSSYDVFKYDLRICAFGSSVGIICEYEGQYVKEMSIKINDKNKGIKTAILNADFKQIYDMTASPNLTYWQIYEYLREQIPQLV